MYKTFLNLCKDEEEKRRYKQMWKDFKKFKKGKIKFLIFNKYIPENHSILTNIYFKTDTKERYGCISDMYFPKHKTHDKIFCSEPLSKYKFKAKKFHEIADIVETKSYFYSDPEKFFSTDNAKQLTQLTPDDLSPANLRRYAG